jgi:hypothetical protein
MYFPAADAVGFATGGTEKLRITSGGQVNIGGNFTSTNNTLQVTGNAAIGYTTAAPTTGLIVAGNVGVGTDSPTSKFAVSNGTNRIEVAPSASNVVLQALNEARTATSELLSAGSILTYWTGAAGSQTERMRLDSSGALIAKPAAGTGAVFNEDGVDADFRVESDTQTHMLFVDAGNNRVGIGTSSPGGVFHTVATAAGAASIGGILQNADNSLNSEVRLLFAPNLSTNWGNRQAYISGVNVVGGGTATELAFGSAANGVAPVERMRIDKDGNVRVGTAALATTATNGFLYIPTCAGTPTGTPTAITGLAPMVIDSTNNKLYIYSGGAWVALN